uniref:Protein LAZ1 n=1 Tax=Leersia perrieri TaxID=77586 RepID=A0A0D9W881_9ORYZ
MHRPSQGASLAHHNVGRPTLRSSLPKDEGPQGQTAGEQLATTPLPSFPLPSPLRRRDASREITRRRPPAATPPNRVDVSCGVGRKPRSVGPLATGDLAWFFRFYEAVRVGEILYTTMRINFRLFEPLLAEYTTPTWATLVAGFFVLLSLSLSIYLIFDHLSAYNNPEEQKFVLGVILMVPCYAIESFVSLINPKTSVYCGILRDGYEAFAMYCFGRYITACLGGEDKTIAFLRREGGSASGQPLLDHASEKGVVIIKTVTASLSLFLEAFGVYCDGEFNLRCGYPYFAAVLNFSQYWALYCLVEWYTATKDELAHIKPLAKFLSFKSIVFLTWWQGVVIAIMYALGLLRSPLAQSLQLKSSIQDFIICIEMGIASVVHLYVFPAKPYELQANQSPGNISVLGDYVSSDPVDPFEIKESNRPAKLKLPQLEPDERSVTNIKESVRDFVIGSGEYVIKDFKFTVNQAVRPVEKRFDKLMKKNDKKIQDDNWVSAASPDRPVRGIDDPLLSGSTSDSGVTKGKKHRRAVSTVAAVDSWGGGDLASDGYEIRGRRWAVKN